MAMIKTDMCDGIAVLELDNGVTNAISTGMVIELAEALRKAEKSAQGVVLCGNEKFFSMGFNLPELIDLDRPGMRDFLFSFNAVIYDLYVLQLPTAVAIEGHAIAGGTILGMAADFRIAAAGKKLLGLNEIKLGLPVPYLALMILSRTVSQAAARDLIYHGEFVKAEKAFDMGLVDEIVAPGGARERAIDKLKAIAAYPKGAFALMKETQVAYVKSAYARNHAEQHERFLDCWFGEATRKLLEEAAAIF